MTNVKTKKKNKEVASRPNKKKEQKPLEERLKELQAHIHSKYRC